MCLPVLRLVNQGPAHTLLSGGQASNLHKCAELPGLHDIGQATDYGWDLRPYL